MIKAFWAGVPSPAFTMAASLVFVSGLHAQQPRTVDAAVLKAAGTATDLLPGSWLSCWCTQAETRHSPLKQIDASNAWQAGSGPVLCCRRPVAGNQDGTPQGWNNTRPWDHQLERCSPWMPALESSYGAGIRR